MDKKWNQALTDYDAVLKETPGDFRALIGRASVHYGAGDVEKALSDYAEITKQFPDEAQPFNDYAWLLATGPKDDLRSGSRAVELANQACKLTEYKNSAYLDTLAAAYAENGDFDNAVKWQREAVKLAGDEPPDVQEDLKSRIPLYEGKKPYREVIK